MAKNRPRLEQHLQRVADFIRSRNQRISLTVHRSRRLKGMQRRFGHIFLEGPESHAFQEILDLLSPNDGLATKHSRTVVDKWLQECVLAALLDKSSAEWVLMALLDKSSAKSLDERIGCAVKKLRSRLQSPLLNWKVWQLVERLKISKQGFRFGK